jgi:putative redox protein
MTDTREPFVLAKIEHQNYTTLVSDSHHTLTVDEPYDKGGMDEGLTPKQLLASSLASCMAITLKMYSDRKEWTPDTIEVKVNHNNIYDTEDPHLIAHVKIVGKLDEKQRARMHVIAQKCPIHKLLHKTLRIETHLV